MVDDRLLRQISIDALGEGDEGAEGLIGYLLSFWLSGEGSPQDKAGISMNDTDSCSQLSHGQTTSQTSVSLRNDSLASATFSVTLQGGRQPLCGMYSIESAPA